jgi:hypothetical protein
LALPVTQSAHARARSERGRYPQPRDISFKALSQLSVAEYNFYDLAGRNYTQEE